MENISASLLNKDIYVISDLHIGDKSAADNFYTAEDRLLSFLDYFESLENSALVLNGDIFEFWQSSMADVFYNNYQLIQRFKKNNAIFIAGNHDYEMLTLAKMPNVKQLLNKIVPSINLNINNKNIKILHGHEFDPFNQPGKAAFTGRMMALLFANLEISNPSSGIEGWNQKYIEPIVRQIILTISLLYKKLFTNNPKLNGWLDLALEEYHKEHPNQILVAGHTHKAGWWNDFYVNGGTWQEDDEAHYVKIDSLGDVKVFNWPSREEVTKQIDLYGYISETAVKNLYYNRNDNN